MAALRPTGPLLAATTSLALVAGCGPSTAPPVTAVATAAPVVAAATPAPTAAPVAIATRPPAPVATKPPAAAHRAIVSGLATVAGQAFAGAQAYAFDARQPDKPLASATVGADGRYTLDLGTSLGAGTMLRLSAERDGRTLVSLAPAIVAAGGGNVVAQGGGNLVNTNGSNVVAQGGGNVVAAGGGNVVAAGGGNVVAAGGGNIVAAGGGNVVAQGGGNVVAQGGGNVVAAGGGNLAARAAHVLYRLAAAGGPQDVNMNEATTLAADTVGSLILDAFFALLTGGGTIDLQSAAQVNGSFNQVVSAIQPALSKQSGAVLDALLKGTTTNPVLAQLVDADPTIQTTLNQAAQDLSDVVSVTGNSLPASLQNPFQVAPGVTINPLTGAASNTADNANGEHGATITILVDAPVVLGLTPATDTGTSSTDDVTTDASPTFRGTATAGSIIHVYAGTTQVASGTTGTDGTWTAAFADGMSLPPGLSAITAFAVDGQGNVSTASASIGIQVVVPPVAPVISGLTQATDTGTSCTDGTTVNASPVLQGTAAAGQGILVLDGTTSLAIGVANGSGQWVTPLGVHGPLALGPHVLTAFALDGFGNTSPASAPFTATIVPVPGIPVIGGLTAATDDGVSSTDGLTTNPTPVFQGTSDAHALIQLLEGTTPLGSGTANGSGQWTASLAPNVALAPGSHSVTAVELDGFGNPGAVSTAYTVVIQSLVNGNFNLPGRPQVAVGVAGSLALPAVPGTVVTIQGALMLPGGLPVATSLAGNLAVPALAPTTVGVGGNLAPPVRQPVLVAAQGNLGIPQGTNLAVPTLQALQAATDGQGTSIFTLFFNVPVFGFEDPTLYTFAATAPIGPLPPLTGAGSGGVDTIPLTGAETLADAPRLVAIGDLVDPKVIHLRVAPANGHAFLPPVDPNMGLRVGVNVKAGPVNQNGAPLPAGEATQDLGATRPAG